MARISRRRLPLAWLAAIAVFALVAASCGGDDDGASDSEPTQTQAPAVADDPAPEPAEPDEAPEPEPTEPEEPAETR